MLTCYNQLIFDCVHTDFSSVWKHTAQQERGLHQNTAGLPAKEIEPGSVFLQHKVIQQGNVLANHIQAHIPGRLLCSVNAVISTVYLAIVATKDEIISAVIKSCLIVL